MAIMQNKIVSPFVYTPLRFDFVTFDATDNHVIHLSFQGGKKFVLAGETFSMDRGSTHHQRYLQMHNEYERTSQPFFFPFVLPQLFGSDVVRVG
jgi:hypothetical protein